MARLSFRPDGNASQAPAAVVADPPATPSTAMPPAPYAKGVAYVPGAEALVLDIDSSSGGSGTVKVLAWNQLAQAWFLVDTVTVTADEAVRVSIPWADDFAFVQPTTVTGTYNVWVGAVTEVGY